VLVRHGFAAELEALGMRAPWGDGRAAVTRGRHLRLALIELGPTFVKLGQFLSTRPDVVPPDVLAELLWDMHTQRGDFRRYADSLDA